MGNLSAHSIIVILVTVMLTNGIGISFKPEVFAHELDHARQSLSSSPGMHLESHLNSVFMDDMELDAATHLCLHAAGQYQPFYFNLIATVPAFEGKETLVPYISSFLPDSIQESPYHPPRILV